MIRYTAEAIDDVARLRQWLLDRRVSAVPRFLARLKEAEAQISANPRAWPESANGEARRYLLRFRRSVYVLHYVEDDGDQIIVRLWHSQEQRP